MERLTAFEFVSATEAFPQMVRLRRISDGDIILELTIINWVKLQFDKPLLFQSKEDLVLEGVGLGKPYWNDDFIPVLSGQEQMQQIALIRDVALRQLRAAEVRISDQQAKPLRAMGLVS